MNEPAIIFGAHRPDLVLEETLPQLLKPSFEQYSNKIAFIFGDQTLTYAELDNWSNVVANMLAEQGIGAGHTVGLWWPRSLHLPVAILGILKSGAAYVPLDREMPEERVETVLTEVGASAYFSQETLELSCKALIIPDRPAAAHVLHITMGASPDNWAYVLYTSGSTGKPKGIAIAHRHICHLIRSEQTVLEINSEDRVYQGFSVSFDMWCEETWISLFAGATLWIADATTAKSIDDLSEVLREQKITILHAVPSLLAVMDDNVPLLRIVNAGGEACTKQVLDRWAIAGRRFYNSYGPTETTVTSTMIELQKGDAITIGNPLPNYNLAVVDEQFNLLPKNTRGELIITGPGVCDGYINKPELTAEKFMPKTAAMAMLPGDRFYRSGDAVVIKEDGSVDFQGRIDDQVKLRGYRIELGEIENQLAGLEGISAAAVAIKKDNNDQEQLVGYVLLKAATNIEEALLRAELLKVLPTYMVPGTIMALDKMPRLPSGKIDRKSLPIPESLLNNPLEEEIVIDIQAPISERVLIMLKKVFPGREINLTEDFFTDLGGHSLLAATFVSRLRKEADLPQASLKDIYQNRPLQALVTVWEGAANKQKANTKAVFNKVPLWRFAACGVAQTVALLIVFAFFALQLFLPFLGYYYVEQLEGNTVSWAILTALLLFCMLPPLFALLSVATKWLVIGKMKEGDYPLWGTYYFRWWFVKTMQRLMPIQFLNGTPFYNSYLKLLGVKVAADAQLAAFSIGAEDLVTIGSDVSISSQVVLDNATVEDGWLKLRKIHLGNHAYLGSSAVVAGGAIMEDWSELQDLSYLQEGKTIKPGEVWQGSPAVCVATKPIESIPQPLPVSSLTMFRYRIIFMLTLLVFPFLILLPLLPVILVLNKVDDDANMYDFSYMPIYVPPLALLYILLFAIETIVFTRLLQRKMKPGTYPIYSTTYVRKWFADQIMSLSLIVLHPIYATVYVSSFFRALGAKIGDKTEISTASSVTHPMLTIGEGSFIADAVTLGEPDVRAQQLILSETSVGNNSFVGNSALIPQGYHLGDNMLIGVLSTPPSEEQMLKDNAKDWFGSPAIALPRRQASNPFSENLTTTPSLGRKLTRSIVEFIRIIIPETAIICFSIFFIAYAHDLIKPDSPHPWWWAILMLPIYYLKYMGIPSFLVTLLMKWVVVFRYKAAQHPMWTWKVWRSEAITTTYEALSVPFLLDFLRGTVWLPFMLRLLGAKIGKRVWLNTTDITEYGMVSISDDAALNEGSGPQTHLFEDRVMKVGPVKIGARSSIGTRSIILYDSEVGDDVNIEPLSLVMKGEKLQNGTKWAGSPVKAM
jgi:non-ribosomal peptide synthetase-like protein